MPNWCTNRWSIYCETPEEAKRVYDALADDEGKLTFQKLVPEPECLDNTEGANAQLGIDLINGNDLTDYLTRWVFLKDEGVHTVEEFREWVKTHRPKAIEEGKAALKAFEETGFYGWYSWRLAHWGCKWDASCPDPIDYEEGDCEIFVVFDTPWNPPVEFFEALREKFPEVQISAFYDEPGMQFAGYL